MGVRAVSPMGDAQVPKEEPGYCTFGGVTACSTHLVELCCLCSYGTNLLLPCMRTCLTASLRALAYRSLVLRAARFRACYFFRSASGGGFPSVSQRSVRYSVAYRLYALWPLALAKACLSCGFVQQAVRQRGSAGAVNSYARTSASQCSAVANYTR